MKSRWFAGRASRRRAAEQTDERADEIEHLLRSGRVPDPRHESVPSDDPAGDDLPADDPAAAASAAVEQVAELLASDLPGLEDDRARAGLRQVGRNLSSAMSALAPYRTSTDSRLRAAYSSVHEAITDLAAVYAWLTFGPGRAQRIQRARDQRRSGGDR
jgi:hypothetical protein